MAKLTSLIKLAENPFAKEESDDDSMDYSKEESMTNQTKEDKGRNVNGPRTKLSNDMDGSLELAELREGMAEIAKAVHLLAKSQNTVLSKLYNDFPAPQMDQEDEFPPMGGGDEMGDPMGGEPAPPMGQGAAPPMGQKPGGHDGIDDGLDLDAHFHGGDFAPYGQGDEAPMRGAEATMQRVPMQMNNARLSKDDASSNFGEKDSDIPGNRKLIPDDKDKSAEEFLIQGGPSAGQSVNKALVKAIAQVVRSMDAESKIAKSSNSPSVGNSQITKAEEMPSDDALLKSAVNLSFQELNRKRVEIGDLPAGIL